MNGLVYNHLPEMPDKIRKAASQLVRKGAFDIERVAKQIAPVDKGLLKNSIYSVTEDTSGAGAASKAWLRSRKHSFESHEALTFPEIGPTGDPLRARVVVGAKYGFFVHEGTRFMRSRPFLLQAYLGVKQSYLDGWSKFEAMIR